MDTIRYWYKMVHLYHFIGKICWQKYVIHSHFGIEDNKFLWANMALKILDDILYHIQVQDHNDTKINAGFQVIRLGFNRVTPVRLSDEITVKSLILDKISTTLLLADYDHKNRESLFSQLSKLFLLTDTEDTDAESTDTENTHTEDADTKDTDSEKTDTEDTDSGCSLALIDKSKVSWYIAESLRTNDKLDVLKVMPFIQFCLKSLDENVSDIEGANSDNNVDIKVQLMTLKNSLSIMNRFKTM